MKRVFDVLFSIYVWIVEIVFVFIAGNTINLLSYFVSKENREYFVHRAIGFAARWVIRLAFIKVEVFGEKNLKNIPEDKPFLIISNHQSLFDILIIAAYLPVHFKWFSKEEVFKLPIIGSLMKKARYISIKREDIKDAQKSFIKVKEVIDRGFPVLIFPEGTRSQRRELLPFKEGSFLIMRRYKLSALPIAIDGSYKIVPEKNKRFVIVKRERVFFVIGEFVDFSNIKGLNSKELRNFFEKKIKELMDVPYSTK